MFDWNDIRIFLAVASEGSTLAASKKLNMNQTTVSRRVQALETALGLTLFERDTRGYCLTAQGSAMIDVAGNLSAAAGNLASRAEHLARASHGKIRVTAAHATMNHWMLPLIAGFRKLHPDIYFETNAAETYVSLENGEADVAIRAIDRIEGDTLIARKLHRAKWAVYCSKSYLGAHGMPTSPEDMANHCYLNYPPGLTESVAHLKWFEQYYDPERVVSTVDSIVTMSMSLRSEDAVGVLPCVEGDSVADLVKCFTHEKLSSGIWLVASKEAYQQPRVRKFMKYVAENFPKGASPASN
ncbi:MAG: LysR family transcriptional regulator [Paracoccaceae bacterium]